MNDYPNQLPGKTPGFVYVKDARRPNSPFERMKYATSGDVLYQLDEYPGAFYRLESAPKAESV